MKSPLNRLFTLVDISFITLILLLPTLIDIGSKGPLLSLFAAVEYVLIATQIQGESTINIGLIKPLNYKSTLLYGIC